MSATTDAAIDAENEIPTPRVDNWEYMPADVYSSPQDGDGVVEAKHARRLEREVVVLERELRSLNDGGQWERWRKATGEAT